jgi:hypothetical protein
MTNSNDKVQTLIDSLINQVQDAHRGMPTGSVSINRNAKGDIRISYRVVHYIPRETEHEDGY